MTQPELHVRPLTVDDATTWAALDARMVAAEGRPEAWSAEELEEELAVPWAHLETRSRAHVDADGQLVGLAWVSARPGAWRAVLEFEVVPDVLDTVGAELLDWAADVARDVAAREGETATVLELMVQPGQPEREALAGRHGFAPVRHFHELVRDLGDPIDDRPPPAGVRIERWDPDRSDDVRETASAAFRDHWGSFPHTAETWASATVGATPRPDLHRVAVAEDTGEVVGYLLVRAFPQDWELKGIRDAWVASIGTLRDWRGRGVASALLVEVMRAMRDDGFTHASLGVDTENPTGAPSLYAGHGFTHERTVSSWHLPLV